MLSEVIILTFDGIEVRKEASEITLPDVEYCDLMLNSCDRNDLEDAIRTTTMLLNYIKLRQLGETAEVKGLEAPDLQQVAKNFSPRTDEYKGIANLNALMDSLASHLGLVRKGKFWTGKVKPL